LLSLPFVEKKTLETANGDGLSTSIARKGGLFNCATWQILAILSWRRLERPFPVLNTPRFVSCPTTAVSIRCFSVCGACPYISAYLKVCAEACSTISEDKNES
ncbi:unnamed protein product, partial [Sphacelaria rigidula]